MEPETKDNFIPLRLKNLLNSALNIPQYSEKWYQFRQNSIGGSEIPSLLNKNKYKSRDTMIAEKKSMIKGFDVNPCKWGRFFEFLHKKCIEHFLKIVILDIGMIQYHKNAHYSPDGVIYLTNEQFFNMIRLMKKLFGIIANINEENFVNSNEILILLELKSPVNRFVHHFIDKPCTVYEDQIKTGTSFLDVDVGMFSESTFKIMSLESFFDIDFKKKTTPNDEIPVINHFKNKIRYFYRQIRLCGIAIITTTDVEIVKKHITETGDIYNNIKDEEKFFKLITEKNCEIDFASYFDINDYSEFENIINNNDANSKHILGFIPWILVELNFVFVEKGDESYKNNIIMEIEKGFKFDEKEEIKK